MDGSSVIFIVMPIVIPLVLFASIAVPYIADRRSGGKRSGQRAACRGRAWPRASARASAGRDRRRGLRRVEHSSCATPRRRGRHNRGRPRLSHVPAAALPGQHRLPRAGRSRRRAAGGLPPPGQRACAIGKASRGWTTRLMRSFSRAASRLDFDYLIVAAGAEANFFGIPDMRE